MRASSSKTAEFVLKKTLSISLNEYIFQVKLAHNSTYVKSSKDRKKKLFYSIQQFYNIV